MKGGMKMYLNKCSGWSTAPGDNHCIFFVGRWLLKIFSPLTQLQISAVRLPREPSNPERLKGFGYAEFEDLDSMLRALSLNEEVS